MIKHSVSIRHDISKLQILEFSDESDFSADSEENRRPQGIPAFLATSKNNMTVLKKRGTEESTESGLTGRTRLSNTSRGSLN